ncbi:hypothetical protein RJ639_014840 [Escallonia herrerae]|uniref:Retrotransposon gag domain-containing protein n=1 Tax=Escallonia herrerae TaxID=1293975 RepID=A0AA89AL91_9ASTE|nr:hypothetical protein RJ639_014840 [Escallonia herrerae]
MLAVIYTMQKSTESLQAAIEKRSELHLDPNLKASHTTNAQKQPAHNHEERHENAAIYTHDPSQHFVYIDDEQSDDEQRNPRHRRPEGIPEVHSKKDASRRTEVNHHEAPSIRKMVPIRSKEHRPEFYTNAPVIVGRPFTKDIEFFPTPANFKMPQYDTYDGTRDPMEHLARFSSCMNLHLVLDQIMSRAFPVTLKGAAHAWFQHLAPRSISCWAQLAESFRGNFLTSRIQKKNSSALFRIVQGPKESLKSYYARFNAEKLLIDHLDSGVTFAAMARGVRPGTPLRFLLNKRPPENMIDLLDRVENTSEPKKTQHTLRKS